MGYSNSPADADPVYNWVHPKNYQYRIYTPSREFGGYKVYFDSCGRRSQLPEAAEKEPRSTLLVAFLGDSFVEALQVPYDSSFVGILSADYPNTAMLNYGVTGYGPLLYYLQCKQMLGEHKINPAAVFMVLYSNDIRNDSAFLNRAVFNSSGNDIIAVNGGKKNSLKALLRKSYLVRLCRKTYLQWQYARKTKNKTGPKGTVVNGLLEEMPLLDSTLTARYILKTAALLQQHNIPLYLTAIPSRYINFTGDTSVTSFAQIAEEWSQKNHIPFVNLHRSFDSVSVHTGQELFYTIDVHCNAAGHALIADAIHHVMDTIPGIGR